VPELPPKRILVVDDEPLVLMALRETLESAGFQVDACSTPSDGLERIRAREYPAVISDQRMPEMTGLEFLQEVRKLCPQTARILITGVLRLNTVVDAINQGEIFRFLAKPWLREELIATAENAYQHYLLQRRNTNLQSELQKVNDALMASNQELERQLHRLNRAHQDLDQEHFTLSQNFDRSLKAWHKMLDTYLPLLAEETERAVALCDKIIEFAEMEPKEARILKVSAWLKNIGYLHVHRDLIVRYRQDPSSLSGNELSAYQQAPVHGESLAYFVDELKEVGRTIRAQYERIDGRGYPDGLAGDLISRPARLLAVIAAFVESSASRARSLEQILELSGKAFCPDAVRLFLKAAEPQKWPSGVQEVLISELRPGMRLARHLLSPSGILLVPEHTVLDDHSIRRLNRYNAANQLQDRILVESGWTPRPV
jgi:response regulator RpfG family c-di-GMP phosphodiesterase